MSWEFAPAIALLPLAAFVIALVAGEYMPKKGALAGIAATAGSLVLSLLAFNQVRTGSVHNETLFTWVAAGELELNFGILIDPLSAMMLVIVSLVALLVHVFSLGYMNAEGESGLRRYYAELGLFTFSMLSFVLSSNLLQAFMFFELVGLCSYLLIGFWFREEGPPSAAKKAFLVTRFGDYFFLVGVVGIAVTFFNAAEHPLRFAGEGSFPVVAEEVLNGEVALNAPVLGDLSPQLLFSILGLLVLGGVVGKSAQFPLHTWLPDAMEGPTTVSALIHAATMVAAGVFLVARMYGFYALLPAVLAVIALVGGFTALFAATMGVVKDDIKQVLAYSTISQYGYMMLGLGAGGYVAGSFHLMNHAFFKALLFLGSGSVIILMHHEQDMWKMGGLKDKAPVTYYTFLAGALALAGIIPFSGFWSKDEILYEAFVHGLGTSTINGTLLLAAYGFGLIAVFFTGFYTFRMVMLTFHGEPRSEAARDPHLPGWSVKLPLLVLGVLATVIGFVNMVPVKKLTGANIDYLHKWLDGPIESTSVHHYTKLIKDFGGLTAGDIFVVIPAAASLFLALAGVLLAWRLYGGDEPVEHTEKLGSMKTVLKHNYYQDEYQVWLGESVSTGVARVANRFDQGIVDGIVNGISSVSLFFGRLFKRLQTGIVTTYAALITLGLVVLLVGFALLGGWF